MALYWHTNPTLSESGPCPICAPLNGTKRRANAALQPPAHPNCKCELVEIDDEDLIREDFPLLQPRDMSGRFVEKGSSGANIRQFFAKDFPLLINKHRRR